MHSYIAVIATLITMHAGYWFVITQRGSTCRKYCPRGIEHEFSHDVLGSEKMDIRA
jgi:hypothetical protein